MRKMLLKNFKFKRCNINRLQKSQNIKQKKRLQRFQRNEIVYAETNESLHRYSKYKNIIRKSQRILLNCVEKRKSRNASIHNYKDIY